MKISSYSKQQGVASLLTAVVLLICITLVVLFTSKTVLMDTKITADNVRTAQATAAAQAAMDQAIAYAMAGGINQFKNNTTTPFAVTTTAGTTDTDGVARVDYTSISPMAITLTSGTQTTTAQFYFDNSAGNRCDNTAGTAFSANPMDKALVVATGWSDDGTATRTISQCVGSFNTLNIDPNTGGAGVPAPLVGVSSIGVKGNGTMINRISQSNIWAGDPNYTISGQSMATYLRKSGTQPNNFTLAELLSPIPTNGSLSGAPTTATGASVSGDTLALSNYTQLSSNNTTGNGVDVIVGDNTLSKVNFQTFFSQTLPDAIATAESEGHCYSSSTTITPDPNQSPGTSTTAVTSPAQACTGGSTVTNPTAQGTTIVIDGSSNVSLPDPLGSPTNPVILIVNGNFQWSGNNAFYGLVYATGYIDIKGSGTLVGSAIPAKGNPPSGTAAGSPTVIYRPLGGTQTDKNGVQIGYDITNFAKKGIISGSWRDW